MVSTSSLSRLSYALRKRPADLSVEDLREIGRQIDAGLRSGNDAGLRVAGVNAAALFTATCSTRFDREQEALLGVQDKVLAGLRAVSSWLTPDLHRPVRAALLPLVAQSGFIKKRKGYRQHLVQALAEAASGPLPPSALLPILCAKETGPAAADLILEVLEKITAEEDNGGGNDHGGSGGIGGNDESKKSVLELLHHVVAEVVTSGAPKPGNRGKKGSRAHLISFLMQACSTLPDYVLVFAKDLLVLAESRLTPARKLSLAVLVMVLKNDRGGQSRGLSPDPTLAAVLRFARSDGDATVRCAAFDSIAEYVGQMDYFDHRDDGCSSGGDNDMGVRQRSAIFTEEDGKKSSGNSGGGGGGKSCVNLESGIDMMDISPCDGGTPDHSGGETLVPPSGKSRATSERTPAPLTRRQDMIDRASHNQRGDGERPTTTTQDSSDRPSRRKTGEGRVVDPWAVGGALLSSLSASVEALSRDGSKTVRAKALTCSLRILEAHGSTVRSGGSYDGATGPEEGPADSDYVTKTLCAVAKGVWGALETLAADVGGATQASLGSAGGGRCRKAADAARDLLTLPCVDAVPTELVICYRRCRVAPGTGDGAAVAAEEAKRAVREIAQARFCGNIGALLRAVSDVMAADECGGEEDGDPQDFFADTHECATFSLSEVLCEVLAGVDGEVIASLLRQALEAYAAGNDVVQRHRNDGVAASAPVLLRTLALLAEANGDTEHADRQKQSSGSNRADEEQIQILAGSQRLFWRRLERRMEDIEGNSEEQAGAGARQDCEPDAGSQESLVRCSSVGGGGGGGGGSGGGRCDQRVKVVSEAVSELSELLRIFRLLATRSLISPENNLALEALIYPAALTRRRLIRPAVGLALALDEPHRVLLSSLAILQDAAFSRSSTDVGRACDYVRLIGVLARENASLIAAHVREQHEDAKDRNARSTSRQEEEEEEEEGEDYMMGLSNRMAMEWEIRRLREASVTCDGMLSCYTPFLLAIVRRRVADSVAARDLIPLQDEGGVLDGSLLTPGATPGGGIADGGNGAIRDDGENISSDGGGDSNPGGSVGGRGSDGNGDGDGGAPSNAVGQVGEGNGESSIAREEGCKLRVNVVPSPGSSTSSSACPGALCAEALQALSEYAVLSPGLAAAQVLPLAEDLAMDTLEHAQIRSAAVGVLTRRELTTDEIAAHVCGLLKDENPRLRREVLGRLGNLMKESRIQTVHLSRLAVLLVDECDKVRRTARTVFFDYLQPRPDEVNRCLFETYFTLDADEPVNRNILQSLIAVAREAAPGQGLGPLGAALVRKAAETGNSEAAFFLSLVPPTVNSLEAAEIALRRGQLAQAPVETVNLVAAHFSKAAQRGGNGISSAGRSTSTGGRGAGNAPSKAQALEIAARIGSLNSRRRRSAGRPSQVFRATAEGITTTPPARPRRRQKTKQIAAQSGDGDSGGGVEHHLAAADGSRGGSRDERRRRRQRGTPKVTLEKSGSRGSKKRWRERDASKNRGDDDEGSGDGGSSGDGALRTTGIVNETQQRTSGTMSVEEEEEEEEWEG